MTRKIIAIISLILIITSIIPMKSKAIEEVNGAQIYSKKETDTLLIWDGIRVYTHIAVYNDGNKEYPAYCLNRELKGLELGTQTVNINSLVTDVKIWRTIINGYPYKSIDELGCQTEDEAYLATKQAVYCAITDRDPNTYSGIGESGERTLNALKQIVSNARSSSVSKMPSNLNINQENSLWKIDNIDSKFVYQTFTVSSECPMNEYEVKVNNLDIEGIKIVDEQNNEKSIFKSSEKFKILLPITNITKEGNFEIDVSGKTLTKPVLYGKSVNPELQNYAIAGYTYEEGTGSKKIYFSKNETKISIVKKDKSETKLLEGVEFELLDNEKNVLYTGLKTDEQGRIEISNLLPGTYYIKEIKTLEGYELYDKLIKVDVDLNENATVNVINAIEEPNIQVEEKESELTVENTKSVAQIKLPKTGM